MTSNYCRLFKVLVIHLRVSQLCIHTLVSSSRSRDPSASLSYARCMAVTRYSLAAARGSFPSHLAWLYNSRLSCTAVRIHVSSDSPVNIRATRSNTQLSFLFGSGELWHVIKMRITDFNTAQYRLWMLSLNFSSNCCQIVALLNKLVVSYDGRSA